MYRKLNLIVACLALITLVTGMTACTSAPSSLPPPSPSSPTALASAPASKPTDWEQLVVAAQKEGNLLVAGQTLGPTSRVLSEAFKAKFGINIDFIESGSGAEVAGRILAQRRAGLYLVDAGHTGDSTFFVEIKGNGITVPLEPFLFLPEVTDVTKWRGGKLPFVDKDRHAITFAGMSIPPFIINTEIVGKNEITRHTDLLNPKWKGKMVFLDPTVGGTANNWFTFVVTELSSTREEGLQFMRDVANQEPVFTRDYRLLTEWVAKGKYPVGMGIAPVFVDEFKRAGAPIEYAGLGERTFFSSSVSNIFVLDRAPHPNAVKLYVNWLLSKEGDELWARSQAQPSLRTDVDNSKVDPALIPPSDASLTKPEGYVALQIEMRGVSRKIFENVLK